MNHRTRRFATIRCAVPYWFIGLAALAAVLLGAVATCWAAAGDLDPTFGAGGVATKPAAYDQRGRGTAVQDDGKILVAGETYLADGSTDAAIVRFLPDGTVDPTYGNGGVATQDITGNDIYTGIAVLSSGQHLVWGLTGSSNQDWLIARYSQTGQLDDTFGVGGYVRLDRSNRDVLHRAVILPDGKFIVGGYSGTGDGAVKFTIARFNQDGLLDPSFGLSAGVTETQITVDSGIADLAVQPDGKIIAAGVSGGGPRNWTIARYDANGILDQSFGQGGLITRDFGQDGAITYGDWPYAVALQNDGKILVAGRIGANQNWWGTVGVLRFLPTGESDTSFGSGGLAEIGTVARRWGEMDMYLQADEKILVTYPEQGSDNQDHTMVARLLSDGTLDTSFGAGGFSDTSIVAPTPYFRTVSATSQPDGNVLVASSQYNGTDEDFAVSRLQGGVASVCGDGNLDADEQCDDGNTTIGDGCEPDCTLTNCPCEAPPDAARWRNHGKYVPCVAHAARDMKASGVLTRQQQRAIVRSAARSTCGHKKRTRCCVPRRATTKCKVWKPKKCLKKGGVDIGEGSCFPNPCGE